MANRLLKHGPDMKRTRDEVAALLKQSEKSIQESQKIHRKLRDIQTRLDRLLAGLSPRRKNPK
jgi:hypothetical protein